MALIGVDLGGSHISAGLLDHVGNLLERADCATDCSGAEKIAAQITGIVRTLCSRVGLKTSELEGVGVACPGWVDAEKGIVYSSANLPLEQFALGGVLEDELGCPVKVENDGNCAALGEHLFGAAKKAERLLLVTVGTGIGAGVLIGGKLLSGPGAAELGHMVITVGGDLCGCGRRGCCERYCSAAALVRQAAAAKREHPESLLPPQEQMTGKAVFAAAASGDAAAQAVLKRYFEYFAEMLMNFISIFRPELVLIGGGVSGAGDAFFVPLRERLAGLARASVYGVGLPPVRAAALGNDAGIFGAAALIVNREEAE